MNILFSQKEPSSGIFITKVEKNQNNLNKSQQCHQCIKREKELNEVVYMKSQIESKYNESVLNLNIQLKANEDYKKQCISLSDKFNKLNDQYSLKQHQIIQLENIIMELKQKTKNISYHSMDEIANESKIKENNVKDELDELFNFKIKNQYEVYGKQICEMKSDNSSLIIESSQLKKQIEMLKLVNVKITSDSSKLMEENRNLLLAQRQLLINNETFEIKSNSFEKKYLEIKHQLHIKTDEADRLNQQLKLLMINNGNIFSQSSCLETENEKMKLTYALIQKKKENAALNDFNKTKKSEMELILVKKINENNQLLEENRQLKDIANDYLNNVQHLTNISDINETNKFDVKILNTVIDQLKNQVELLKDEIIQLNQQNNFLKIYYDKSQANYSQNEYPTLFKPKDRNENLIEELDKKLIQYEEENRKLSVLINKLQKESFDKQDLINTFKNKLSNLQSRLSEIEFQCLTLQDENCNLNKEIVAMKMSYTDLTEINIKLQTKHKEMLLQIENNTETVESINRVKKATQQINNSKEQIILNLNNEILIKDKLINENKDVIFEQSKTIEECKENLYCLINEKEKLLNIIHKKK